MFKISRITGSKIFLLFYSSLAVICALIFVCSSLFLYKNFYQTIIHAQEVLVLRREVAIDDIDMDKFDQIIKKIELKEKARDLDVPIRF